jgi:hypothetical protein
MTPPSHCPALRRHRAVSLVVLGLASCAGEGGLAPEPICASGGVTGDEVTRDVDAPARAVPLSVVLIGKGYEATSEAWDEVMVEARKARPELLSVGYKTWAETETAPGTFVWSEFEALPPRIDDEGIVFDIATPVGFSGGLDVPSDLAGKTLHDDEVWERYERYVESALANAPEGLRVVTLHAEGVAEYFAAHDDERELYCDGIERTIARLHELDDTVRVGVYWRYENDDEELFACVNRATDHTSLALILNPPDDAPEDVAVIVERYVALSGEKPLAIVEAGYPSSPGVDSSPEDQEAFVDALFDTVARHSDALAFVAYYEIFNESRVVNVALAEALFGPAFPEQKTLFVEWITSLGLQCEDDAKKPAWFRFLARAAE